MLQPIPWIRRDRQHSGGTGTRHREAGPEVPHDAGVKGHTTRPRDPSLGDGLLRLVRASPAVDEDRPFSWIVAVQVEQRSSRRSDRVLSGRHRVRPVRNVGVVETTAPTATVHAGTGPHTHRGLKAGPLRVCCGGFGCVWAASG
jgi:hypothetical protein